MPTGHLLALLVTLALVAGAGGAVAGAGETVPEEPRERPRPAQRLAAELGVDAERLRGALDTVREERRAQRAERRAQRVERRGKRGGQRSARAERRRPRAGRRPLVRAVRRFSRLRERFAAPLAARLEVEPAEVTAALRSLLTERLERAERRGRLTAEGREAALACFDDRAKCQGLRALLRPAP